MDRDLRCHIQHLIQKLKTKLGFLCRIRRFLSSSNCKTVVQSTCPWLGRYSVSSCCPSTLQRLNPVYHSALRFITNDKSRTHHCITGSGWTSLQSKRNNLLMLFIYKALLLKLPNYLTSLLSTKSSNYSTRSSNYWTGFKLPLKLESYTSLGDFKALLSDVLHDSCYCFS